MSTQAYYKERLGFDPADTVAEHQREQRSQHGYEESLTKFKGQNANGLLPEDVGPGRCNGVVGEHRAGNTQAFWGCWAMFIEAHGRWRKEERSEAEKRVGMRMLGQDFFSRGRARPFFFSLSFSSPFSFWTFGAPFWPESFRPPPLSTPPRFPCLCELGGETDS